MAFCSQLVTDSVTFSVPQQLRYLQKKIGLSLQM
jgi:hypothetical protein